jgi:hypothetical protein
MLNRASRGAAYPGEIILERLAISNRLAGRDHRGFASDFPGSAHFNGGQSQHQGRASQNAIVSHQGIFSFENSSIESAMV